MSKRLCPICGNETVRRTKKIISVHNGVLYSIDLTYNWCESCKEGFLDPEDKANMKNLRADEKQKIDEYVNADPILITFKDYK